MRFSGIKFSVLTALIMAVTAIAAQAQVHVQAVLKPEEVDLGEATQLHVEISGTMRTAKPEFPRVDGLVITYVAHTTNFRMINGASTSGVNLIYHVQPHRTGVFTIPSVEFSSGGEMVRTNPVTLRVAKAGGGYVQTQPTQQAPQPQAPFAGPAPQPVPTATDAPPELSSQMATIQLLYPKRDFYVGELVPAQLRLYLYRGLAVREVTLPMVSGTAFTVGRLGDQPDKRMEMINGKPFAVYTWNTAVAAIRPGEHPLGAKIEAKILIEEQARRRSPFGDDPFADSFFNQFFRNYEERRVTLKTADAMVKVLPLPDTGKPDDFNGAIGKFDVSAEAAPTDVTAGDPITLKVGVSGTGNFDRVKLPELKKDFGFKTYAPSSKFDAEDASGSTGRKTFEQMVVPQRGGIDHIPPITFSYFDPDDKKYVTVATREIPIQVKAGAAPATTPKAAAQSAPAKTHSAPTPGDAGFTASDSNLVANKLEMGSTTASLTPVVYKTWFWAMQAAPLSALAVAFFIARRRNRLTSDPAYARSISASRAVQAQLQALNAAEKLQDTPAFFQAARRILQERLAEKLGGRPEAITLADLPDIEARMTGLNGTVWPELKAIFDVADAVAYSGQTYSAESLQQWKTRVLNVLRQMEKI